MIRNSYVKLLTIKMQSRILNHENFWKNINPSYGRESGVQFCSQTFALWNIRISVNPNRRLEKKKNLRTAAMNSPYLEMKPGSNCRKCIKGLYVIPHSKYNSNKNSMFNCRVVSLIYLFKMIWDWRSESPVAIASAFNSCNRFAVKPKFFFDHLRLDERGTSTFSTTLFFA